MDGTKPFSIPKQLVMDAYKAVKANAGAAGVDRQTIQGFEENLKDNLYKVWNRMSSGTYFPPAVRAVPIPKKSGGERILGIPSVSDRIAQTVVKMVLEPRIEPIFCQDSYGYRPGKSALDAVGVTRQRCWQYDWVLEWDIKGLFDEIPHEQLLKAIKCHTDYKWVLLCIERWLKAPMCLEDGTMVERTKGTPQGGVISPCLANLYMHYAFDAWIGRTFPGITWCRYADDGLVHCKSEAEAQQVLTALGERLTECGLSLYPDKTKIVYCKDGRRTGNHSNTKFDFLGYTFRGRRVKSPGKTHLFVGFTPAASACAMKAMRQRTKRCNFRNRSDLSMTGISRIFNPTLRGWMEYYGAYCPSALSPVWRHFNKTLVAWAMRKYRRLKGHKIRADKFIEGIAERQTHLFIHWQRGTPGSFV